MSVAVRVATLADVAALQLLIARSARALSVGFYTSDEAEAAIRHVFGVDSQLVRDGTYFVAELAGALAGCGGWSYRRTLYGGDQRPVAGADATGRAPAGLASSAAAVVQPSEGRLEPGRDAARVRAFFVAPEAARRGVGRAILAACEGAAVAAGFTRFELMATLPGVPFYEVCGYRAVEEVTDVLPDGTSLRFVRMERTP